MSSPLWIFGYGSLVWRPTFPHAERRPAHVRGWARRFWQGSTDHRGVPGAPGRVVTLIRDPDAVCLGVAYHIDPAHAGDVLEHLDDRERGGYDRHEVELVFDGDGGAREPGLVYVATPANQNYLGPAPLDQIAAQVRMSRGPSGPNLEYVLRLAEALRDLEAHDDHVFELEDILLQAAPWARRAARRSRA